MQVESAIEEVAGWATKVYQAGDGAARSFEQAIAKIEPVANAGMGRSQRQSFLRDRLGN
ncbi:hypothetical protein [Trichothermofontia sp.]